MNVDDYEKQHASAQSEKLAEYACEGDGASIGNAALVMRVIDAFLTAPCGKDDAMQARSIRRDWTMMKKNGTDWSTWPERDVHRLEQILMALTETFSNAHDIAVVCYVKRALFGKNN